MRRHFYSQQARFTRQALSSSHGGSPNYISRMDAEYLAASGDRSNGALSFAL